MSKIIRHVTEAPSVFIGKQQRDAIAETQAERRMGDIFPLVSLVTSPEGAKLVPILEVYKLEEKLRRDCDQARQQGYEQGHKAGLDEGLAEARKVLSRFEQAIQDAVNQRAVLLEEAKRQILDLVVQISRKVTFDALEIDREATISMIEGIIGQLVDRSRLRIKVHPDHLPLLEQHMDRFLLNSTFIKELTFEADPRVRMGGCFIETPTGDIDARLKSQFEVISEVLQADGEES